MRSADFVKELGDAYRADTQSLNGGFPIFSWQKQSISNPDSKGGGTSYVPKPEEVPGQDAKTETIKADTTVNGSKATASVKKDDVDKAVKAVGSSNAEIVIDAVSGRSGVTKSEVTVPAESVKAAAKDTNASLVIKTDAGDIKIANKDLSAVTGGSGSDITFTVEKNADGSVKVSVKSGGKEITTEKSVIRVSFKADDKLMKSLADKAGSDNSNLVVAIVKADRTTEIIRNSFVNKDGTVTADIAPGATVTFIANGRSFSDVAASAWYAKAVGFAVSHELFNGVSDTEFAPSKSMTRGMFVTVLNRLADAEDFAGKTEFSDVAADKWYTNGTAWAVSNKIVSGYGNGRFGPDDAVTREQMAVIMYNFTKAMGYDIKGSAALTKFSDSTSVHSWAAEAMQWAVGTGVMSGNADGTLDPRGTATRAQVATIMSNYVQVLLGVK